MSKLTETQAERIKLAEEHVSLLTRLLASVTLKSRDADRVESVARKNARREGEKLSNVASQLREATHDLVDAINGGP